MKCFHTINPVKILYLVHLLFIVPVHTLCMPKLKTPIQIAISSGTSLSSTEEALQYLKTLSDSLIRIHQTVIEAAASSSESDTAIPEASRIHGNKTSRVKAIKEEYDNRSITEQTPYQGQFLGSSMIQNGDDQDEVPQWHHETLTQTAQYPVYITTPTTGLGRAQANNITRKNNFYDFLHYILDAYQHAYLNISEAEQLIKEFKELVAQDATALPAEDTLRSLLQKMQTSCLHLVRKGNGTIETIEKGLKDNGCPLEDL